MQVRKTRRKTKRLGVAKISPQEGQAGAPVVGCSRERKGGGTHLGEKMNRGVGLGSPRKKMDPLNLTWSSISTIKVKNKSTHPYTGSCV
jgi:hypothetical protein